MPARFRSFFSRMAAFFRRGKLDGRLRDELQLHAELLAEEKIRNGIPAEEARRRARVELGGLDQLQEEYRDARGFRFLEDLAQDARYALRQFRRSPGFTAVALLTLGLVMGANVAVFNLIAPLEIKSLPVERPEELVCFRDPGFSYPVFEQVRNRTTEMFAGFFASADESFQVEWPGGPETAGALLVSEDFFSTLGVQAGLGRTLAAGDSPQGGNEQVAVISDACWRRRFASDRSVLGKTIRIDRVPFTIVGVAPRGFFGIAAGQAPEVIIPVAALFVIRPEERDMLRSRGTDWLHFTGRLKPGLTLAQANSRLELIWPQALEATAGREMPAERRQRYLSRKTALVDGRTGFSPVRNQFSEPLRLLFALAGVLLLVGCATVANLLLARASARTREITARAALGARRSRLIRQFLTEGLLLAAIASLLGLAFARSASLALVALLSTRSNEIMLDVRPDWLVAAFTGALTLLTALLFSIVPAVRATGGRLFENLKSGNLVTVSPARARLGKALVVVQVALSLVLLAGAALFVRSLRHLLSLDPGFRPEGVLVVRADLQAAGYHGSAGRQFYERLLDEVQTLPGVASASLSYMPPLSDEDGSWTQWTFSASALPESEGLNTWFNAVSPGYFRTLGTQMTAGRDFSSADKESAPRVVIINQSLARAFFGDGTAVGRSIHIGKQTARRTLEIVGVVVDSKYQRLQEQDRRIAYLPYAQVQGNLDPVRMLEFRTLLPPGQVLESVRGQARALDSGVPITIETLSDRIRQSLVTERAIALLSTFLGGLALLIACTGLYGVISYSVERRANEIGIRLALGAGRPRVLWMVLRESLHLALLGTLAGLAAALALARLIAAMLHGISAADPLAFGAAAALQLAVALVAGYVPARRAMRLDPLVALRCE